MDIPLGREETLCSITEQQGPKDTLCYCPQCRYKRANYDRVITNFYYGFAFFPLWLLNCALFLLSLRLSGQYEFSESIAWEHSDEVFLQGFEDEDSVVGAVVREHEREARDFDAVAGWSAMAASVLGVLVWIVVMVML